MFHPSSARKEMKQNKTKNVLPGVMAHDCNPGTLEAKAGDSGVLGQDPVSKNKKIKNKKAKTT
jgi:hypothetical protein